jgi:hypothetical protein
MHSKNEDVHQRHWELHVLVRINTYTSSTIQSSSNDEPSPSTAPSVGRNNDRLRHIPGCPIFPYRRLEPLVDFRWKHQRSAVAGLSLTCACNAHLEDGAIPVPNWASIPSCHGKRPFVKSIATRWRESLPRMEP